MAFLNDFLAFLLWLLEKSNFDMNSRSQFYWNFPIVACLRSICVNILLHLSNFIGIYRTNCLKTSLSDLIGYNYVRKFNMMQIKNVLLSTNSSLFVLLKWVFIHFQSTKAFFVGIFIGVRFSSINKMASLLLNYELFRWRSRLRPLHALCIVGLFV